MVTPAVRPGTASVVNEFHMMASVAASIAPAAPEQKVGVGISM
jgi:hypothetical protein